MPNFVHQTTQRVVSTASRRELALVTVGLTEVDHARVARLDLPLGEARRFERLSDVFRLLEAGVRPIAVLVRHDGMTDPLAFLRILRHHQLTFPVYVVCGSRLEASYFGAQQELGPVIGLVEPLDAERLQIVATACAGASLTSRTLPADGEVNEDALASLLVQIHGHAASGVLNLTRRDTQRRVFFSHGEPVYAESNLLTENFGRQLRARGVIGDVEYEWAQRVQAKEGIRQGEALVRIGALTRRGLYTLLRDQIRDKILNAFVPGTTHYRFETTDPGGAATSRFELNLGEIVINGLWRARSDAALEKAWDHLNTRYLVLQRTGQSLWRSANQVLSTRLLQGVDERRPIAELFGVDQPLRERLATLRLLELGKLGFINDGPPTGVFVGPFIDGSRDVHRERGECDFADLVADTFLSLQGADHYGVLGVDPSATRDEIGRAVTQLRERFDRAQGDFGDADLEFQLDAIHRRLDEAFNVLGNDEERAAYFAHWSRSGVGRTQRRSAAVDAEAAYRRGLDALRLQRVGDARDAFRAAQALNPQEPLYRLYEGWTLVGGAVVDSPQWQRGRQLINRALGANPLMADGYHFMARVHLGEGDPDSAVETLRMALRLDPNHDQASALLTELAVGDTSDIGDADIYIDLGDD